MYFTLIQKDVNMEEMRTFFLKDRECFEEAKPLDKLN